MKVCLKVCLCFQLNTLDINITALHHFALHPFLLTIANLFANGLRVFNIVCFYTWLMRPNKFKTSLRLWPGCNKLMYAAVRCC